MNLQLQLKRQTYQNPTLTERVHSGIEAIKAKVKNGAEATGLRGLPAVTGDQMDDYYREYHQEFVGLMHHINKALQISSIRYQVSQADDAVSKEEKRVISRLKDCKDSLNEVKGKLEGQPLPVTRKTEMWVWIGTIAIAVFEAVLSLQTFSGWGLNYLEAIVASVLFAGFLVAYAYVTPKLIATGKTNVQRWIIVAGIALITVAALSGMGYMRAKYIAEKAREAGSDAYISTWPLVVFSCLLLGIALALHEFYMPSKAERQYRLEYQKLVNEKRALEQQIDDLTAAIQVNNAAKDDFRAESAGMVELGSILEQEVIHASYGCFDMYKNVNLLNRSDKPDCFSAPYPFEFTRSFNFNNQSDENS